MNLYIKQKVFTWGDQFTIKDAQGRDRHFVEGEVFTFGKKLHILSPDGREEAFIEQQLFTWTPRYRVYIGGRQVAEVVRKFSFLFPSYSIEGLGWEVEGDFFSHEYQITKNGKTIATISKEWMTWGDSYQLSIGDGVDEIMALAVVLAIDAVIESSKNNHH